MKNALSVVEVFHSWEGLLPDLSSAEDGAGHGMGIAFSTGMCRKILGILALLLLFVALPAHAEELAPSADFGTLHIYKPVSGVTRSLILLVSGDGGWMRAVASVAPILAAHDRMVVGIDIRQYFSELSRRKPECVCASCDFDKLGAWLKQRYGLDPSLRPILVGYSSGATLVYAALVQAQSGMFQAAFSFGFCPDLEWGQPFCHADGMEVTLLSKPRRSVFAPTRDLVSPWLVFQGEDDQVCNPDVTEQFVQQVSDGKYVALPKVGHGFSKFKNWLRQFETELDRLSVQ